MQEIFLDDPNVLCVSLHRHDGGGYYPASGAPSEVGESFAAGKVVNVAWGLEKRGSSGFVCSKKDLMQSGAHRTDADYLTAFKYVVIPIVKVNIVAVGFSSKP